MGFHLIVHDVNSCDRNLRRISFSAGHRSSRAAFEPALEAMPTFLSVNHIAMSANADGDPIGPLFEVDLRAPILVDRVSSSPNRGSRA